LSSSSTIETAGLAMARTKEVDTVRGLALLGICVVNVPFLAQPLDAMLVRPTGLDLLVQVVVEWLFQGKFFLLFSFIFGWGLAVQIASAKRSGVSASTRFLKRLAALAAIGIAHAVLVFSGDILLLYAILGVALLLLRDAAPRTLMMIASVALVIAFGALLLLAVSLSDPPSPLPASMSQSGYRGSFVDSVKQRVSDWPFAFGFIALFNGPMAFAAFCAGLAAAKVGFFDAGNAMFAALRDRLPLLLGAGLGLSMIYALSVGGALGTGLAAGFAFASLSVSGPLLGCAYLVIAVELARKGYFQSATVAAGRMSLTAYVLEGVLAGVIFNGYGLGLYGSVGAAACLLIAVLIYAATHLFAVFWLRHHDNGPLETLLRAITRLGEPHPVHR
jgi:uncharacterized protein